MDGGLTFGLDFSYRSAKLSSAMKETTTRRTAMTGETKKCRHCGAEFTTSRTGKTVHCPEHRTAESRRAAKATGFTGFKTVSAAGRTCTVRRAEGVCGKPAIFAFESGMREGEIFAECAEHH